MEEEEEKDDEQEELSPQFMDENQPGTFILSPEQSEYSSSSSSSVEDEEQENWVEQYTGDNSYHIVDNEGCGDCLFGYKEWFENNKC